MTKWSWVAVCIASLLLPSWAMATEIVCICPQGILWDVNSTTSAFWAYRYTREDTDDDCTDDALEAVLHYDSPALDPVPSAYCVSTNRCAQCIQLGPDVHLPETQFRPVAWNSEHGLGIGWTIIRTCYVQFNTRRDGPARFAKLFLLHHDTTKMMLGYGFEIDGRPDAQQVDPASIIRIGPNRCPPLLVYYANGTTVATKVSTTVRRVTIGNVFYIVRAAAEGATVVTPEGAPSDKSQEKAVKNADSAEKEPKKQCCAGTTTTALNPAPKTDK